MHDFVSPWIDSCFIREISFIAFQSRDSLITHVSKEDWWDIGILYCGGGSINRDKFSGFEDGSNRRPSCYQGYQQFYDPSRGRQMLLRTSRGNESLRRLIWSGHRGIISNYLALFPTTRHVSDAHCSFFTTATNPMKIH